MVKLSTLLTPAALAAAATPGDHHDWPAAWTTDVLNHAVAHHVHPGSLKNGQTRPGTNGEPDSVIATIAAPKKTAYLASQKAVAQAQIVTATARLAALLNAIAWP